MPLQLRRGVEADRTTIVPANGELIYTTDTKLVYVGDGSTVGGTAVTGGTGLSFSTIAVAGQSNVVADSSTDTLTLAAGTGVTITTNAGSDTITIASNAMLNLVDDTTPQLGGDLNLNNFKITTPLNSNLLIEPNGTGSTVIGSALNVGSANLDLNGSLFITQTSFLSSGFAFSQHHEFADASNFVMFRTRGTATAQTTVRNGDDIIDLTYLGYDGSSAQTVAAMSVSVDGTVSAGKIPGRVRFFLNDGITSGAGGVKTRLELVKDGTVKFDQLGAITGTNITLLTNNSLTVGDVRLSQAGLSTINSNANLVLTANSGGRVSLDGMLWPASDGSNGQVLSTNGSGSLSWTSTPTFTTVNATSIYSSTSLNIQSTSAPMDITVNPSMFGNGEDLTIRAGDGGDIGAVPSTGGSLVLLAGQGGVTSGLGFAAGGNIDVFAGAGSSFPDYGVGGNVRIRGGGFGAVPGAYVGNVIIQGLTYPKTDGSSGQVLTTNGAGILSWTSVSGLLGSLTVSGSVISSTDSTRIEFQENVNVVGNFTVEGTLGYGTGTGGTTTQSTNKTTGVTFNKACGTITTASGSINSGDEFSFTVTNSFVDDTDVVLVNIKSGGTAGAYLAQCDQVSNGSFRITVTNISNSTLDETLALNFIIVKSVSA